MHKEKFDLTGGIAGYGNARFLATLAVCAFAYFQSCTFAYSFQIDRSAMSEAYWKIWNDEVQAKIDADIEKYRKADAETPVNAPDGTEVKIEQLTHAFFFGAHIFNFDQLGRKEWNDRYKALYDSGRGLFNSATVAFYWRTFERFPGKPRFEACEEDGEEYWCREYGRDPEGAKRKPHWRRPPTDPVIDFLERHGCRIHGHPLVWGNNTWMTPNWLWDEMCPDSEKAALEEATGVKLPRWDASIPAGSPDRKHTRQWQKAWKEIYAKLDDEQIAALVPTFVKAQNERYERRIREIGERYGKRVHSWDVVNESATDWARGKGAKNSLPITKSGYGLMPANYAYNALVLARIIVTAS